MDRRSIEVAKLTTFNILAYSFLVYNNSTLVYYNTPFILTYFLGSNNLIYFTYLSVVISFVGRILGANYLARIGDRYSRKFLTRISSIGSCLPLIFITLLPQSPSSLIAFLFLYFFQGLFTGGLTGGLNVIGLENLEEKHRGWFSGTGISVGGFSYLIVTIVYYIIVEIVGLENYVEVGWKISFATSILIVIFSFLMPESIKQLRKGRETRSREIRISKYRKELLYATGVVIVFSSLNLLAQAILPNFLYYVNKIEGIELNTLMLYYSLVAIPSGFLGGLLSEFIGRKRSFLIGSLISPLGSLCYFILGNMNNYTFVLISVVIISFTLNFGGGGVMAFVNENFPVEVRSTGVALSWSLGWFSGSIVVLLNTFLVSVFGLSFPIIVSLSILCFSIAGIILSFIVPETKGNLDKM
ncbi:MAG: MFS transporter [Sulfolobaceae archaeon]